MAFMSVEIKMSVYDKLTSCLIEIKQNIISEVESALLKALAKLQAELQWEA